MLDNAAHLDRRHHAGRYACPLESVPHSEGIHDCCQHPHVVPGHSLHARSMESRTAEQIASTYHHADLNAETYQLPDLDCHSIQDFWVNTEIRITGEGFSG